GKTSATRVDTRRTIPDPDAAQGIGACFATVTRSPCPDQSLLTQRRPVLPGYSLGLEQADAATLAGRHAYAQRRARGLGFRLSQRGALRGSMGQAASD